MNRYAYVDDNPLRFIDPFGLSSTTNNSSRPVPYKPSDQDGVIQLCCPGKTCDIDGFYPPDCTDFPIKVVDHCTVEIKPDGSHVISCPWYAPDPDFRRRFPKVAQKVIGGKTDADFHKDHSDWHLPNHKANCGLPDPCKQWSRLDDYERARRWAAVGFACRRQRVQWHVCARDRPEVSSQPGAFPYG